MPKYIEVTFKVRDMNTASIRYAWRLCCESKNGFLQLVPVGIFFLIIPEVAFTSPGQTAAASAVAEACACDVGDHIIGASKYLTLHAQFFHPDLGSYIGLFHCLFSYYLITDMPIVCSPRHLTTVDNRVKKPYRRLFLSEKAYKCVCLLVGIDFFCTFASDKQRSS